MAGYALARIYFRGREIIFLSFVAMLMIPTYTKIVPQFLIVKFMPLFGGNDIFGQGGIGWLNSWWALIIPGGLSASAIFLFRQFYLSLPTELEEAARLDGLGEFRIFAQIYTPLIKPAIATVGPADLPGQLEQLPLATAGDNKQRPARHPGRPGGLPTARQHPMAVPDGRHDARDGPHGAAAGVRPEVLHSGLHQRRHQVAGTTTSNRSDIPPMSIDLSGRRALVTGSGAGIGAAIAIALAEAGADVAVHYANSADGAAQHSGSHHLMGRNAQGLRRPTSPTRRRPTGWWMSASEFLGGLDILVNNAGHLVGRSPINEMSDEHWDSVIGVNVSSTFYVTRRAVPLLEKSPNGRVILMSSLASENGGGAGSVAYAAAEGGRCRLHPGPRQGAGDIGCHGQRGRPRVHR